MCCSFPNAIETPKLNKYNRFLTVVLDFGYPFSLSAELSGQSLRVAGAGPTPLADDAPTSFGSKTDGEGYPIVPLQGEAMMSNGRARMKYPNWDLDAIARRFGSQLGSPVHNDTGLTGKYDLELKWGTRPPNPDDNAPDFITAVQGQLGLKLEKKKAPVDIVVLDHVEKTPSGN
jgi:uncharacterized protein (TIGR03435 family)